MARLRILCSAILFSFLVAVCLQNTFYCTKSQWNILPAYKTGPVILLQGLQLKPHQNKPNRSQPCGRRYFAARMLYYVNSDASFSITRLAISGDVEPNHRPVCTKKVFRNHRVISCDVYMMYLKWSHRLQPWNAKGLQRSAEFWTFTDKWSKTYKRGITRGKHWHQ